MFQILILTFRLIVCLRVKDDVKSFFHFYVITYVNSIRVREDEFFIEYDVVKYFEFQNHMFENHFDQMKDYNFFCDENI